VSWLLERQALQEQQGQQRERRLVPQEPVEVQQERA
jgi:hypothetical protein